MDLITKETKKHSNSFDQEYLENTDSQATTATAAATVPASFLGGSTSCLLLSATHFVRPELRTIPHSGYISSEAMFACFY